MLGGFFTSLLKTSTKALTSVLEVKTNGGSNTASSQTRA